MWKNRIFRHDRLRSEVVRELAIFCTSAASGLRAACLEARLGRARDRGAGFSDRQRGGARSNSPGRGAERACPQRSARGGRALGNENVPHAPVPRIASGENALDEGRRQRLAQGVDREMAGGGWDLARAAFGGHWLGRRQGCPRGSAVPSAPPVSSNVVWEGRKRDLKTDSRDGRRAPSGNLPGDRPPQRPYGVSPVAAPQPVARTPADVGLGRAIAAARRWPGAEHSVSGRSGFPRRIGPRDETCSAGARAAGLGVERPGWGLRARAAGRRASRRLRRRRSEARA